MSSMPDDSSSDSGSSSRSSPFESPSELLTAYDSLLRNQFDVLSPFGLLPTQPSQADESDPEDAAGDARPMTKAEKQNAKKKRRKERERLAKLATGADTAGPVKTAHPTEKDQAEAIGFRLFSSRPVQLVSLVPVEETYTHPANPRHQRFSEEQVRRRREMAEQAAVDFPQLGGPSAYAPRWTRLDRSARTFILSNNEKKTANQRWLIGIIDRTAQATANTHRSSAINLTEKDDQRIRKRMRRGRSAKVKDRPLPAYWTPGKQERAGGKGMATMWGHGLGMVIK